MSLKSKLRDILRDIIVKVPVKSRHDLVKNRLLVTNLPTDVISAKLKPQPQDRSLIRVAAVNSDHAELLARRIQEHKDNLHVTSVKVLDEPVKFKHNEETNFAKSVIVTADPSYMLKAVLSEFNLDQVREDAFYSQEDDIIKRNERVVIDYSSPNIAKQFHMGHLKSTILGNFLANINQFAGHRVTRLNYLGDWGTQFGLLLRGLELFGQLESSEMSSIMKHENPLKFLLSIYVRANQEAKLNEAFREEAQQRFSALENDQDANLTALWKGIRDLSLSELKNSYKELGIQFDSFEYESDYVREAEKVMCKIEKLDFVSRTDDGALLAHLSKNGRMYDVPLMKSDGASLYLARDVAAVLRRKAVYNFDRMLYVVGVDQERHFHSLFEIIEHMGHPEVREQLVHVKMGKVLGMSTRSGDMVLLSDILDNLAQCYRESTLQSPTSKVTKAEAAEVSRVGHHLALTALFVNDMRNPRLKHYQFEWKQLMQSGQRSGINLQTTYARLSSLLTKSAESGIEPARAADQLELDAVLCLDGMDLLNQLDLLEAKLYSSYSQMDPSELVNYALDLCKCINRATRSPHLHVLSEPNARYARTRLRLFERAREQLDLIIKLLGLKPLQRV